MLCAAAQGLRRVPCGGFRSLGKRLVLSVGGDARRLPAVHTCTFQLDLPEYSTPKELQDKLDTAVNEQAFALA